MRPQMRPAEAIRALDKGDEQAMKKTNKTEDRRKLLIKHLEVLKGMSFDHDPLAPVEYPKSKQRKKRKRRAKAVGK